MSRRIVLDTNCLLQAISRSFAIIENAPLREVEKFGLILPSTRQTQSKRSVASAERLRPLQFKGKYEENKGLH